MPPEMPRPWFSPSSRAAEASWTPCRLIVCNRESGAPGRANSVTCRASACRRRPIIRGTSGPYRSASTRPARCPWAVRARARFTATVVFPTPPFPLATAMTGTCSGLCAMNLSLVAAILTNRLAKLKISLRTRPEGFCWRRLPYIVICIVLSLSLRRIVPTAAAMAALAVSVAGSAVQAADAAVVTRAGGTPSSHVSSASLPGTVPTSGPTSGPAAGGPAPRQQFVPDLIAAVPGGITPAELAKIRKLGGVAAVLAVDGGRVTVNGKSANVLGVSPQDFRPWTPLATASSATIWSDLSQGQLISTGAAARKLGLTAGQSYPVSAAILEQVPFGRPSELSVPGADAIVNLTRSAQLGLAKNFAVLINAPRDNLASLKAQVEVIIGKGGQVVNLVAYTLNA